jgi:tight adherence protein C
VSVFLDWHFILLALSICLGLGCLMVFVSVLFAGERWEGMARLEKLAAPDKPPQNHGMKEAVRDFLSKAGTLMLPARDQGRVRLETRLRQAGLYGPGNLRIFLGVKLLLASLVPLTVTLALFLSGLLTLAGALVVGIGLAAMGLVAPGLWLDHCRAKRQSALRQALPDALDLMVLCLEGGVSLTAAVQRVTEDLEMVHPLLAAEMMIVQRAMQLGSSAGEAMKLFADRCDLAEVRDLSCVLLQSERFGAGVSKALRIHADTARQERQQRAEEMAQKAAVKILFPTLLCIFPAVFIVLLGPAAYQMMELMSKTR